MARTCRSTGSALSFLSASLLLLAVACSKRAEISSPVVASVGESAITAADLKSYLSARPPATAGAVSREDVEKRLEELVLEEVLYGEALRRELDQDPEVQKGLRQMLTRKLLSREVDEKVRSAEIGESDLQKCYDQHWGEFNRPEERRLADIFIAVSADATEAERAERRQRAEQALGQALEAEKKRERSGFGRLIEEYSDAHERYARGDTGFFDEEGKPGGVDPKVAQAAFRLERVGAMLEEVIEAGDGFHVVMLTGKRSAVLRPLKDVRKQLELRIRRELEETTRKAYLKGLREKTEIEIDEQVVGRVLEEVRQARSTAESPPPAHQRREGPPELPRSGR